MNVYGEWTKKKVNESINVIQFDKRYKSMIKIHVLQVN